MAFSDYLCATVLALVCGHSVDTGALDAVNGLRPVGSAFTRHLSQEYRTYANWRRGAGDLGDAAHFAKKALSAAHGENVMPENLQGRSLSSPERVSLVTARAALLSALEGGGRQIAPQLAALVQSRYDCWVEQAEGLNLAPTAPSHCKVDFDKALRDLQKIIGEDKSGPRLAPPASPQLAAAPVPGLRMDMAPIGPASARPGTVPLDQALFLVFFDWNKSHINDSAKPIVDAIALDIKNRSDITQVVIVGHADTSGPDGYNQRLSQRRAAAVQKALQQRGISATLLTASGKGERELLVRTADNVREPANRRAEIRYR